MQALSENRDYSEPGNFYSEYGIEKEEFYANFDNLKDLEQAIWVYFFEQTYTIIGDDISYPGFTVREKLLSFYYTHIEVLKQHRDYITSRKSTWLNVQPLCMKAYKNSFVGYVKSLVKEGIQTGEIADRKFLTDFYAEGFWLQLLFVIRFWSNDKSTDFDKTDAAIEKAVTLSFELIISGPVEAFYDFAKFIIQNRSF